MRVPSSREELARLIDHTILNPAATPMDVERYCREVIDYGFYSVVVNPFYVNLARQILGNRAKVGVVVGFPFGASKSVVKAKEAELAILDGADEVDMVMNIGAFKAGMLDLVKRDIRAVVKVAHEYGVVVKVIIETGYLNRDEKVKAARLVMESGADFVKTSTGYGPGGASEEDVKLLYEAVEGKIGVKAAGGIRNAQQAIAMIKAGASRIGTSHGVEVINSFKPS
ncbi:MAG: deoxyribose-phosphate aldolase [Caldivirga sp.]